MPASYNRIMGRRGGFLLYSRDAKTVCRLDVKTGVSQEVFEASEIDPHTLSMVPDERSAFWTESRTTLVQGVFSGVRKRPVYTAPQGWQLGSGMSVSEDGFFVALVEVKDKQSRIRLVATGKGLATTVTESSEAELHDPVIRPKRAGLVYGRGNELWLGNFDASQNYKLRVAAGEVFSAHWSQDGRIVEYLVRAEGARLPALRECQPDANEDKLVAPTSQFASVSRNGDSSVFVGASSSKASPHVLLLLRSVKREFTLAEHKASDPGLVAPVFSPNSQRIFFQTDRDGKWAIYMMQVEKLVEETEN
jgi:oligogalacturonide lyase